MSKCSCGKDLRLPIQSFKDVLDNDATIQNIVRSIEELNKRVTELENK